MSLVRDGDVAVWMPVGQWLRADAEPINGNGIEPDEVVEVADPEAPTMIPCSPEHSRS